MRKVPVAKMDTSLLMLKHEFTRFLHLNIGFNQGSFIINSH